MVMKYCRFIGPELPDHSQNVLSAGVEEHEGQYLIVEHATGENADVALLPLDSVTLLPPVAPTKIVCVGRNYRDHAKELGHDVPTEPLLFLKPPSTLIASGEKIVLPHESERVDYEGELGVVIEKRCSKLKNSDDVKPYIRGYVIANDVTARDLQNRDSQWTRAKGFDTF